jgi:hypothetical protein
MGSEIPLNSNFKNLSCQLGGLTLNGNVVNGTAKNYNVVTINDPLVIQSVSKSIVAGKFLQIQIGPTSDPNNTYYLPLYQ